MLTKIDYLLKFTATKFWYKLLQTVYSQHKNKKVTISNTEKKKTIGKVFQTKQEDHEQEISTWIQFDFYWNIYIKLVSHES